MLSLNNYNNVYSFIKKSTLVSYCIQEMNSGTVSGTYPLYDVYLDNYFLRNIETGELKLFINIFYEFDSNSNSWKGIDGNYIDSEKWSGKIKFLMDEKNFDAAVIFHELNHAAQYMIEKLEGLNYYQVKKEIETRLILFYTVYLDVTEQVRSDPVLMEKALAEHYGYMDDLTILCGRVWGHPFDDESSDFGFTQDFIVDYPTVSDRYNLVLAYFNNPKDSDIVTKFNKYMLEYQRWLYYVHKYNKYWEPNDYNKTDFNYYLLDRLRNGTLNSK